MVPPPLSCTLQVTPPVACAVSFTVLPAVTIGGGSMVTSCCAGRASHLPLLQKAPVGQLASVVHYTSPRSTFVAQAARRARESVSGSAWRIGDCSCLHGSNPQG
jgi:hypothetical protein